MAELVKDQMLEDEMAKDEMVEDEVDINHLAITYGCKSQKWIPKCLETDKITVFRRYSM